MGHRSRAEQRCCSARSSSSGLGSDMMDAKVSFVVEEAIPAQEDSMAHHFVDVHLEPWARAKFGSNRSSATSASWSFSLR